MPLQSTLSGRGPGPTQAVDTQSDGKSFEQLRQECLREGVLFEDPDFPAADSSLFFSQSVPVQIEWKRPTVRWERGGSADALVKAAFRGTECPNVLS